MKHSNDIREWDKRRRRIDIQGEGKNSIESGYTLGWSRGETFALNDSRDSGLINDFDALFQLEKQQQLCQKLR